MANFDLAFEHVLKYEGSYVDDPVDPGGETKYGISKRSYPHLNIKDLTIEQAKSIYKKDWWDRHPELHDVDQDTADAMFSCLINVGALRYKAILKSSQALPTATGTLPSQDSESPAREKESPSPGFSAAFRLEWIRFYYRLVKRKTNMRKYLVGWLARALGE